MGEMQWVTDKARFVRDASEAVAEQREPRRDHGFPLGPLGQQFAALTYCLLDARSVDDVLQQVTQASFEVVPQADLVSLTLRTVDGRFHTPAESDPIAGRIDKLQYDLGEGPSVDASMAGGPTVTECGDLRSDQRWTRWAPAAINVGIRAVLSTHLKTRSGIDECATELPDIGHVPPSGALNLYSRMPRGLDDVDADQVLLLATHASLALAASNASSSAQIRETQLRRAIDSRDVIGQAKGILRPDAASTPVRRSTYCVGPLSSSTSS